MASIFVTRLRAAVVAALVWAITALLVFTFARAGIAKFSNDSGWAVAFEAWGYAPSFRMLVGAMEIMGAALILVPRIALYGVALIATVMLGAMGTHLLDGDPAGVVHEIIPLTLALVVGAYRWRTGARRLDHDVASFFRSASHRHAARVPWR